MTLPGLRTMRLAGQHITAPHCSTAAELVHYMTAMQAQEYAAAKWAIGLRLPGVTHAAVEQAFNEGAILRTHVLRPTWHFVSPDDIGWLLQLTAPRVHAANAFMTRKCSLDAAQHHKANQVICKALEGGHHLTRTELQQVLERSKIATGDTVRLSLLMMHAELEGLICSGPRRGKQFTYALLAERAPDAPAIPRAEALQRLGLRYYSTRGPATAADFAAWSGLTLADARAAAAGLPANYRTYNADGQTYYYDASQAPAAQPLTFLMPAFDEYLVSYKERSAVLPTPIATGGGGLTISRALVVVNGVATGTWADDGKTPGAVVKCQLPDGTAMEANKHLQQATDAFKRFHDEVAGQL